MILSNKSTKSARFSRISRINNIKTKCMDLHSPRQNLEIQLKDHHSNHHFKHSHAYPLNFNSKSTLMLSKRCSLFILFIILNLLSVNANQHFSDDLNSLDLDQNKHSNDKSFLNEFAIELDTSSCPDKLACKEHLDTKANDLADKHGFINQGQVSESFLNYYFFKVYALK